MKYLILATVLVFTGCGSKRVTSSNIPTQKIYPLIKSYKSNKILSTGFDMVKSGEIVKGSCWDYIDKLYSKAGYKREDRIYAFKGSKNKHHFAPLETILKGDWLYFINQSYGKVEHSGVFISWKDRQRAKAIILSYGGENRKKPARYRVYDISEVFTIVRGVK